MAEEKTFIQLRWEDPETGLVQEPLLEAPVALGRESPQMPEQWGNLPISKLELPHKQVSRFHALITLSNQQLYITDKSANGTYLNGRLVQPDGQVFTEKDTLRIGPYKITAAIARTRGTNSTELNIEHSQMDTVAGNTEKSAMFLWIAGAVVLLAMGLGTWKLATFLLEQARPQPDAAVVRPKDDNRG
jgi:hypothetical protein